jgi:hypothetical protein
LHTLFVLLSLTLAAALAFTGVGLLAIISVFVAVLIFFLLPLIPDRPVPVLVRRLGRRPSPRAPPLF